MLKLIQIEFFKLRRRKLVWIMLLAGLVMPFFTYLYYRYLGMTSVEPIQFYTRSALLAFVDMLILPFVLGVLCTLLMDNENQNDMLKQLWIVPVSKMGYFFSKFFVVLLYSICFMLITAISTVLFGVLPGYVIFDWGNVLWLLKKCLEIGILAAFAILPILAIATTQKGYILSFGLTLLYVLMGIFLMTVNMYLHPICSMMVIIAHNGDIPNISFTQAIHIHFAFLCIGIWDIVAVLFANIALKRRK